MTKKELLEQMPKLTDEEIEAALQKDYNGEVCVDDGDRAIAQAQRELLAKEGWRKLPDKYRQLGEFLEYMVARMEEAEPKYGDWRKVKWNVVGVIEHLRDEFNELRRSGFDSPKEAIDVANLCFMLWCIGEKKL